MPPLDTLDSWSQTHVEAMTFAVCFGVFAVLAGAIDLRAQHIGWLLASPWHTLPIEAAFGDPLGR